MSYPTLEQVQRKEVHTALTSNRNVSTFTTHTQRNCWTYACFLFSHKALLTSINKSGHAYRCFCTPDRLSQAREKLARTGSNATYDKACLHLTEEEAVRRVRAGEKHIVRLNVCPLLKVYISRLLISVWDMGQEDRVNVRASITDLVFGPMKDSHAGLPTDPILLKSDLFPTYHLASVVDDYEMGITHVLRGEVRWSLFASYTRRRRRQQRTDVVIN